MTIVMSDFSINISDLINIAITVIALFALIYTARSVRIQAQSVAFTSVFELYDRYSNAWQKYQNAQGHKKDYELLELLNLIENTCHLYNDGNIPNTTRDMIQDYLTEVMPLIFNDEQLKKRIEESYSGPDTYFYIRRFAKRNRINGVPQQ